MKETWKMIALLAIAIGGLLAYAFIPEQVAENIPLKQIGMDALTSKSEAELAEEEKADSMIKEPVDTAAAASTDLRRLDVGISRSATG